MQPNTRDPGFLANTRDNGFLVTTRRFLSSFQEGGICAMNKEFARHSSEPENVKGVYHAGSISV